MPVSENNPAAHPTQWAPTPYWSTSRAALYLGDVRECLRAIPARSVHCFVTSPPYWGLRSYLEENDPNKTYEIGMEPSPDCGTHGQEQCGACFVCSMVSVFREVHRVLRDDGTLWLNLGDKIEGEQLLIPYRSAQALQLDGWRLVQDIIWYAPNKMPEPVKSRCVKSHEHIFLMAKGSDYYFDSVAIEEPAKSKPHSPGWATDLADRNDRRADGEANHRPTGDGSSNKRDVWIVPTRGYPGAHYAVFSSQLITPCILAGTSELGACAVCRRPWERVVTRIGGVRAERSDAGDSRDRSFNWSRNGKPGSGSTLDGDIAHRETAGWHKVCGCHTDEVSPCVVLDPFVGSGTTVATAIQLGRNGIGIELSETYLRNNAIPCVVGAMRGTRERAEVTSALPPSSPPAPRRVRG